VAKVTVITATTGNPILKRNIESVARQTHQDITHLVMIDGPEHNTKVQNIESRLYLQDMHKVIFYTLPWPLGKDRWNGHRIYGASTYMCESDYVMYLDEDVYLEPSHIEDCIKVMEQGHDWAFSLRKIVNKDGDYLCDDDCESLGKWSSVMDPRDYFVDVNCYFLPLKLAIQVSPIWYRKAREPGVMEVDRAMCHVLRQIAPNYESTYNHTVNYTVGNSVNSVQLEFFTQGNIEMKRRYNNQLPWRKV
jgi:hypothetical protein